MTAKPKTKKQASGVLHIGVCLCVCAFERKLWSSKPALQVSSSEQGAPLTVEQAGTGTLVFEGIITTLQDGVVCCSYVSRFACDFVQSLYHCNQP